MPCYCTAITAVRHLRMFLRSKFQIGEQTELKLAGNMLKKQQENKNYPCFNMMVFFHKATLKKKKAAHQINRHSEVVGQACPNLELSKMFWCVTHYWPLAMLAGAYGVSQDQESTRLQKAGMGSYSDTNQMQQRDIAVNDFSSMAWVDQLIQL